MLSWSRQFLTNITTYLVTITYFQLYLTLLCGPGSRNREGRVVEEEVEADRLVTGDLRRARVMTDIANQQFTLDCPGSPPPCGEDEGEQ